MFGRVPSFPQLTSDAQRVLPSVCLPCGADVDGCGVVVSVAGCVVGVLSIGTRDGNQFFLCLRLPAAARGEVEGAIASVSWRHGVRP